MDHQRVTMEKFVQDALFDFKEKIADESDESIWGKCVACISDSFYILAFLLFICLAPIVICLRLAVTHADRVVFVLASSILSFYQVPRKVFGIYIAVVAFTGFLQFLRYHSSVRSLFLRVFFEFSCGTSNMFLRKFTTLHFSNPFTRCFTTSPVVYVPMGLEIQSPGDIEIFDFPVLEHLNFDKTIGDCKMKIETLDNITGSSTTRGLYVEAPWGNSRVIVNMESDNLGRLISYFNRVIETKCTELICSTVAWGDGFEALSFLETIKYFNSGAQLVKLDRGSKKVYLIH